jgi:putative two-component system response regulator
MTKKIILAIDDVDISLMITKTTLQDYFDIRLFKSAKAALAVLDTIMPDLVLLDIEMPEMTGFELLSRIRENASYDYLPVIFVTSHLSTEFINQAMAFGVDGYLVKPFTQEALVKRINMALEDALRNRPPNPGAGKKAKHAKNPANARERLEALKEACRTGSSLQAEVLAKKLENSELHDHLSTFDWNLAEAIIDGLLSDSA